VLLSVFCRSTLSTRVETVLRCGGKVGGKVGGKAVARRRPLPYLILSQITVFFFIFIYHLHWRKPCFFMLPIFVQQ
jgi:hypothetical protein